MSAFRSRVDGKHFQNGGWRNDNVDDHAISGPDRVFLKHKSKVTISFSNSSRRSVDGNH